MPFIYSVALLHEKESVKNVLGLKIIWIKNKAGIIDMGICMAEWHID